MRPFIVRTASTTLSRSSESHCRAGGARGSLSITLERRLGSSVWAEAEAVVVVVVVVPLVPSSAALVLVPNDAHVDADADVVLDVLVVLDLLVLGPLVADDCEALESFRCSCCGLDDAPLAEEASELLTTALFLVLLDANCDAPMVPSLLFG